MNRISLKAVAGLVATLFLAPIAMAQVSAELPPPPPPIPLPGAAAQPAISLQPVGKIAFENDLESIKGRLQRRKDSAEDFRKQVEDTKPNVLSTSGLTDRREVIVELTYIRSELEEFRARIEEDEKSIGRLKDALEKDKLRIERDILDIGRLQSGENSPEAALLRAQNELKASQENFERNKEYNQNFYLGQKRTLERALANNAPLPDGMNVLSMSNEQFTLRPGAIPKQSDIGVIERFISEVDEQTVETDQGVSWAQDMLRSAEASLERAKTLRAGIVSQGAFIPLYDAALRTLESVLLDYEAIKDQRQADAADVDQYITNFISNADSEAQSTWMVAGIFFLLMAAIIWQLFRAIGSDDAIKRAVFSNDAALQFVALLSIIIAIIIFGITKILGGNELSALLGSIAGYILGRSSDKLGKQNNDGGNGQGADGAGGGQEAT